MRRATTVVLATLLGLAITGNAWARHPHQRANYRSGLAVYGGVAVHDSSGEFTEPPFLGQTFDIDGSGLSLGLDYMFSVNRHFSVHVALQSSSQNADSDVLDVDTMGHGVFGLQARVWFRDFYIGAMGGRYSEVVSGDGSGDLSGGYGNGGSLLFGVETRQGFLVGAQFDRATVEYSDAEADVDGFRLHVGWRFRFY